MINMRKLLDRLRLAHLCHFSKPAGDRMVYRAIRRAGARRILELGVSHGLRARRMIEVAAHGAAGAVCYAGVDLFELRPDVSGGRCSLKEAHALLKPTGARVRLIPGDPYTALARTANEIGPCDLIVIASDQAGESLERAWFYLPRLLHAATTVLQQRAATDETAAGFELLAHHAICRRAAQCGARRRAA